MTAQKHIPDFRTRIDRHRCATGTTADLPFSLPAEFSLMVTPGFRSACFPFVLLAVAAMTPAFSDDGGGTKGTSAAAVDELAATKPETSARRHPLRGLITAVDGERSSIMVKHEAIPGVMRAMTMLFKVDAATLKIVEPGQMITATLSREGDEWWLHDLKVVAAPAK